MNSHKHISEDEVIPLLLKKDAAGLEYLYDNYSSILYGIIFRITGREQLANELLIDCYVKIWQHASQYNPVKDRLGAWLINIARRMSFEKLRDLQLHSPVIRNPDEIPSALVENGSGSNQFSSKLKELDKEHLQIFHQLFYSGLSPSEISLKLNLPLGTVKNRLRTTLRMLRNESGFKNR